MGFPYSAPILRGSTSKSVFIHLYTTATGLPVTGVVFNAAGLEGSYAGTKLARVATVLADLAAITTAWASGGFKEVDATEMPGLYRYDVPNAALALAVDEVAISITSATVSGTVVIPIPTTTVATGESKTDLIVAESDFVSSATVRSDN